MTSFFLVSYTTKPQVALRKRGSFFIFSIFSSNCSLGESTGFSIPALPIPLFSVYILEETDEVWAITAVCKSTVAAIAILFNSLILDFIIIRFSIF